MDASDRPFLINDCVPNRTRFNIPILTRFISGRKDEDVEFQSSKWKKELAKTSEEIFDQISKSVTNRYLAPEFRIPDEICVRPPLLVFRNDGPKTQAKKLSFSITNRSKHTLDLTYEISRSEIFQVQMDQITLRRLSPRQSLVVSVRFTPNSEEDDFYVIKFTFKRGSFNIPVLSIGPRYLVSCDDSIMIDEAYINLKSSVLLPLTNLGPRQLDLIMFTEPPFSVEPSRMILAPYSCGKVEVAMKAHNVGKHTSKLRINHETGEDVFVNLVGIVVLGDITLNKNVVIFPGVYMNTKERETVILQSNVQHPVSFSWRRYKTEAEDRAQIDKLHEMLGTLYSYSPNVDIKPDIISQNVINKDTELAKSHDCFSFDNPFFVIEPLHGTIAPMSTFECSVFFQPEQLIPHKMKAYLHIECRMERAELDLEGYVLGPQIDISVTMVDLSLCQYLTNRGLDLVFTNNGPIAGTVNYISKIRSITCEPLTLNLMAFSNNTMILLINFNHKGPFLTELKFRIEESGKILTVCLKGNVVGLPISIDVEELNYGVVALGFSNSLTFSFINDGDNHFEYTFVIANDGTQTPLRISEFTQNIRRKFPPSPKEFTITPSRGVIKPKSRISVEVVFIPNKYYERPTELLVLVNGVPVEDLSLRISYYCHHPMITCNPFEIELRYLIVNETVELEFTMTNEGSAPAAFVLSLIGNALRATFSKTNGILESGHTIPIKATITPVSLGSGTVTVGVDLFGRSVIEEAIWINYTCSAPSLAINPYKLDWHITELTAKDDLIKQMTISNPFRTPIFCRIKIDKPQAHMWRVSPRKATVELEQVVTLKPVVIDFGKSVFTLFVVYEGHRDEMKLVVDSSICTSIRSVPSIFNGYDFGNVLKNTVYSRDIKFINQGMKPYTVMSKPREKDIYTNPFSIKPRSFLIRRKERLNVCLEFHIDKFGHHQSTYDIIVLDKRLKKCPIGACTMKANVVPKGSAVSWEPEVLELVTTSKEILTVQGSIRIFTTVTCLDEIECVIHHPYFSILDGDNRRTESIKFQISPSVSKTVRIIFDTTSCPERFARFDTKMYIRSDTVGIKNSVNIIGEVNFPHFTWSTQIVDFGCLCPFQDGHEEVKIVNKSSETLSFDCHYISIFERRPDHFPLNEEEMVDEEEEREEEEAVEKKSKCVHQLRHRGRKREQRTKKKWDRQNL
ncbi:hypothetical protein GE061_017946 [Apolygus lucorum]|uniref:HYDIN/VesB/CFA65-like Ig-like domain-containing protein n=1 Tax=Apolygus lucorum TaxID=248454 RepID=A0A8S9XCB5_APOLU|nr:hypothetical protein GE061_017946 [Apolygus lucorum]